MTRSSSNSQQIELQRRSLDLQEQQGAQQLSFMEAQLAALRQTQVAPYKPQSPPPTMGTASADYAAAQQLIENQRRFGYGDTTRGGIRFGLGGRKVA